MGTAEQFEAVASQAAQLASRMQDLATHLSRLGATAVSVIGGTATGDDQAMLSLAHRAMTKTNQAATHFQQAAAHARLAAADQREQEHRHEEGRR